MARVTVEDCLQTIPNRFQLVLVGAKRARQLALGKEPFIDWENDKPTVVALREIAEGKVTPEILEQVTAKEHAIESTVTEEELRDEMSEPSTG